MGVSRSLDRLKKFVREFWKNTSSLPLTIAFEDFKYIWNYQMVIVPHAFTIDLQEPLLDITLDLKKDILQSSHLFPFVVGNGGMMISATSGRRVLHNDPQESFLYLEYILDAVQESRVILKIMGNDPQSISIICDQRKNTEIPMVLFMYKPKSSTLEKKAWI